MVDRERNVASLSLSQLTITKWVIRDGGLVARLNRLWCEHCCGNETPRAAPDDGGGTVCWYIHPAPGFFFDELGNGDCDVCFFYYFLFFASLFFYLWVWGGIINDICFAGSLRFNRSIQPNMYIYDDDQSFSCGSGSSSIWYNQHQSTVISFYFLNLFNTPRLG